jgi:branched-chain amino acid transport system substrate-binding protein
VRELGVVTLIVGGLSNNEIGALLGSGGRTVGKHAERILAKLGQSTRAGVAALAVEEGLLRLPPPDGGGALRAAGGPGAGGRERPRAGVVAGHRRGAAAAAVPDRLGLPAGRPGGRRRARDDRRLRSGRVRDQRSRRHRRRPVEQIVVDLDRSIPAA